MKIVILFFIWIAATPGANLEGLHLSAIERCKQLDPAAELTVWPSEKRRYKFNWKGLENRNVYDGADLICAVVRKQVVER